MLQALLYFNPTAGRQPLSPQRLRKVMELLYAHEIHCQVVASKHRSTGPPQLDLADKELLVAMGGDGTIHELLPIAVETGTPLGVLPTGTANVLATELGIPSQLQRAVKILRTGLRKPMSLGKAGTEYFHLMAGIGLDGYIIQRTSLGLKKRLGKGAYWLAGLQTLFDMKLKPFELEIAGNTYQATFAVISNCHFYGGRLQITPKASPFSDQLEVCIFHGQRRLDFIRYALGILSGHHTSFKDVTCLSARKVNLKAWNNVKIQLDGDLVMDNPRQFEIEEKTLRIVVPKIG